ncbi:MAG: SDR family oxidoreductase [Promethearchaeota archaeon]
MSMDDKICMITGANSGIGKATALSIAKMGAVVIMICRDKNRGENAQKEIINETGNKSVDLFICDLSSQESIYKLAENFKKKYQKLDVLINNAGVVKTKRILTIDGFETTFAVNYLAPFLLTNLLLDIIKESAPSRIINIISGIHKSGSINFDDLQAENKYRSYKAYGQSKLALILFTYELSKKLEGTSVTVNALHPGFTRTNIGRDYSVFIRPFTKLSKNPKKGAETSIYLATSPEVEGITGKYFIKKQQKRSSKDSYNEKLAKELWNVSLKLTKLNI